MKIIQSGNAVEKGKSINASWRTSEACGEGADLIVCEKCLAVFLIGRDDVLGIGEDAQVQCPECHAKQKSYVFPTDPNEPDDDCPKGGTHEWFQGTRTHECCKCGAFSAW